MTYIKTTRGFTGRIDVDAPTATELDKDKDGTLSEVELQSASNEDLTKLLLEVDKEEQRAYRSAMFWPERAANLVEGAGDTVMNEMLARRIPIPARTNRYGAPDPMNHYFAALAEYRAKVIAFANDQLKNQNAAPLKTLELRRAYALLAEGQPKYKNVSPVLDLRRKEDLQDAAEKLAPFKVGEIDAGTTAAGPLKNQVYMVSQIDNDAINDHIIVGLATVQSDGKIGHLYVDAGIWNPPA